jgi:hypothetical protein
MLEKKLGQGGTDLKGEISRLPRAGCLPGKSSLQLAASRDEA